MRQKVIVDRPLILGVHADRRRNVWARYLRQPQDPAVRTSRCRLAAGDNDGGGELAIHGMQPGDRVECECAVPSRDARSDLANDVGLYLPELLVQFRHLSPACRYETHEGVSARKSAKA